MIYLSRQIFSPIQGQPQHSCWYPGCLAKASKLCLAVRHILFGPIPTGVDRQATHMQSIYFLRKLFSKIETMIPITLLSSQALCWNSLGVNSSTQRIHVFAQLSFYYRTLHQSHCHSAFAASLGTEPFGVAGGCFCHP